MRCFADDRAHDFPIEDATGAYCPEHGVTLLRHPANAPGSRTTSPVRVPGTGEHSTASAAETR